MAGDREHKKELIPEEKIMELSGKLGFNLEQGLMHSVLEDDKDLKDQGKLLNESLNQGFAVIPENIFEDMVNSYSLAQHVYGSKLIKLLSGYDNNYIKKNIHVPEFQKELKEKIEKKLQELKDKGFIDGNSITNKGLELASVIIYIEEIEKFIPKGSMGRIEHKKVHVYGTKQDVKEYKKERYKDIAVKKSVKRAIRRGHKEIIEKDLLAFKKKSKGKCFIVYALDASGSMKGEKIQNCKRAGIALAYSAINKKDEVGLIVFGNTIKKTLRPSNDFVKIIKEITRIRAANETDIASTIKKSIELFPRGNFTKHLMIISDALPTMGKNPEEMTLEAASLARNNNITISVVGIKLDIKGKELAKKIADIGSGRLYTTRNLENIDRIVLEDYYEVM